MNTSAIVLTYHRKPETKTSFLREPGPGLFPERIGYSTELFTPVKRIGAAFIHSKMGQIKASFKKFDESIYKSANTKNPCIHFTLFEIGGIVDAGFANVAYSGSLGKMVPTNDLIICKFIGPTKESIEVMVFPGQYQNRETIFRNLKSEK